MHALSIAIAIATALVYHFIQLYNIAMLLYNTTVSYSYRGATIKSSIYSYFVSECLICLYLQ